jgi:DNA-binding response OmpR family regulator
MVSSNQDKKPIRILVVDDEENILELMDAVLTREGFEVLQATNGIAALSLIEKIEFDLIITDHEMPGMTGIEFFRLAKKLQSDMDGRFLFISGRLGGKEFHQLAAETRAGILFKPFEIKELREMARMLINHRHNK